MTSPLPLGRLAPTRGARPKLNPTLAAPHHAQVEGKYGLRAAKQHGHRCTCDGAARTERRLRTRGRCGISDDGRHHAKGHALAAGISITFVVEGLPPGPGQAHSPGPEHHIRGLFRIPPATATSGRSSQCLIRFASATRETLPKESSSTMITGFAAMVACITRQRPALPM